MKITVEYLESNGFTMHGKSYVKELFDKTTLWLNYKDDVWFPEIVQLSKIQKIDIEDIVGLSEIKTTEQLDALLNVLK